MIKIVSWNINGYRSITGQNPSKRFGVVSRENRLFKLIAEENPQIVCLQEIKASEKQIKPEFLFPESYHYHYSEVTAKKGYSGVGLFSKIQPLEINTSLGIEKFDSEGRFQEIHFENFSLFNIYFPKGYADSERLDYKMDFYDAVFSHIEKIRKKQKNIIIVGDFNTAHKEIDLARPKQNQDTSGFLPVEREKFDDILSKGWIDAFRKFNNNPDQYTWWSQRGRARENNVGWRIDYQLISEELADKLLDVYHLPDQQGSDHCPVVANYDL